MRRTATHALQRPSHEDPVLFAPRSYQRAAIDAWEHGAQRLALVWHRQAGKDQTAVEIARRSMFGGVKRPSRAGLYFHIFPTFALGRDALWIAGSDGKKNLDGFPREFLLAEPNQTEMQMRFRVPDGEAIWQIMGADDPDAFRGTRPVGVVLSEYAEMNPEVEDVLTPVLAANDGWMIYAYTPKGRNHGWRLWQFAQQEQAAGNPRWYADRRTVEQTRKDGLGESGDVVTPLALIEEQRRRGAAEEFIQQEYYTSFDASLVGSYYGDLLRAAEREGRITRVPWEPTVPCVTAWDLGYDDCTAIWIVQSVGRELRVLDYLEGNGEHIPHYAKRLKELEYVYAEHLLPHDAEHEQIASKLTIEQQLKALGIRPTRVVERASVELGIQAVRGLLPKMVFDARKCQLGLERLAAYRKTRDQRTQEFRGKPLHDAASDAADALRTLAMGFKPRTEPVYRPSRVAFTPYGYAEQRRPSKVEFRL